MNLNIKDGGCQEESLVKSSSCLLFIEPPETFEQAAIREAKEESGIDIILKGILRFEYKNFLSNS